MKLEHYAKFRKLLEYHGLYYDINLETNEYVVWDKNGDAVVSISSNQVRNDYEAARDILITAVNVVAVFGAN